MGQNQQAIFQQGEPLSNYDVIQKVPEHNISYLKHKLTNKEYLIRQFAINDKTQFTQTFQKVKNRKKLDSQHLTKLQRYSEQMENNICSSFYKIFAMWEYPTHTLSDEINQRALKKRRFQESQIFSITASIIQGMSCLQISGIKHQSLTTSSILFDQTGTVIVADPLTSIHPSNFDRINTNRKIKNVYISPEQCQSLKNQRPIPNRNPYKSDVFVLGLILLECGLLQQIGSVFVQDFEQIDLQEVQNKLEQFAKHYSQDLKLTVETMLTRDPKERMDWVGLKQYIPEKNNQNNNKAPLSIGQVSQTKSINFQPFNKLTLGGKNLEASSNLYNKEHFNKYARYDESLGYTKGLAQGQNLNQAFGQQIQSVSYQPIPAYVAGNLPVFSSNTYTLPQHQTNTFTPFANTQFGNQKVSEYVFETKIGSQRPTELSAINGFSKITPAINNTLIDRDSSSFPLNSQFQFKKDYLNNQNAFSTTQGLDYQPINKYSSTLYTQPPFSLGINKYQPIVNNKPILISEPKLQIASQVQGSPFQLNHVKDAKSITYEKNFYNSYLTEEKSHLRTIENADDQQPQYSAISQNIQPSFSPNSIYQPITKIKVQGQQTSAYKISSNPVLYQPLGGANSRTKQKPNLNPQMSSTQDSYQQQVNQNGLHQIGRKSANNFQNLTDQQNINTPNVAAYSSNQKDQINSQNKQLQYVIEHFRQGSRYEGTKYQDMRHGQGKFFYQDGGMYEGNWRLNKMDGYGKLYYQSGKIAYQGNWSEDQFQGYGKLYNQDPDQLQQMFDFQNFDLIEEYWAHYEGNFLADQKNGQGKMVFSNGQYFVGNFHQDMVQGPGQFHRLNGQVIKGVWNQNQMVERQE